MHTELTRRGVWTNAYIPLMIASHRLVPLGGNKKHRAAKLREQKKCKPKIAVTHKRLHTIKKNAIDKTYQKRHRHLKGHASIDTDKKIRIEITR